MRKQRSRKVGLYLGVTAGLLLVMGVLNAALAQEQPAGDEVAVAPQQVSDETSAFTYQGRLVIDGVPANGDYEFTVNLYASPTGGSPEHSCLGIGAGNPISQHVQDGIFTLYLVCGGSNPSTFTGAGHWLEVAVRQQGGTSWIVLPRQPISPTPYAFSLAPGAVINGAAWHPLYGGALVNINNTNPTGYQALWAQSATGSAVHAVSPNGLALDAYTETGYAVYGRDAGTDQARGYAGYFESANGIGIYAFSGAQHTSMNQDPPAIWGRSANGTGVYGESDASQGLMMAGVYGKGIGGYGVRGQSEHNTGVYGSSGSGIGVSGSSGSHAGVSGESSNGTGVSGKSTSGIGVSGESRSNVAIYGYSESSASARFMSYNGNLIEGWENVDRAGTINPRFRVEFDGDVYADGTYYGAGGVNTSCAPNCADYAETMDADQAGPDYEPGDVLVVNREGLVSLSNAPYAPNVLGVYSTKPAFLARAGETDNQVPVALVGVVPVKACAENGPIVPGDLLSTSSTPGRAMRAGPNPPMGTVIGKALQPLETGEQVIKMLVMLH